MPIESRGWDRETLQRLAGALENVFGELLEQQPDDWVAVAASVTRKAGPLDAIPVKWIASNEAAQALWMADHQVSPGEEMEHWAQAALGREFYAVLLGYLEEAWRANNPAEAADETSERALKEYAVIRDPDGALEGPERRFPSYEDAANYANYKRVHKREIQAAAHADAPPFSAEAPGVKAARKKWEKGDVESPPLRDCEWGVVECDRSTWRRVGARRTQRTRRGAS